jgi:hypothetical protein
MYVYFQRLVFTEVTFGFIIHVGKQEKLLFGKMEKETFTLFKTNSCTYFKTHFTYFKTHFHIHIY